MSSSRAGEERDRASSSAALPEVWSVGELTRRLGALVAGLGRIRVEGEVSRVSRAASGHVYFDLTDPEAKLACKLWRSQVARALAGELREGDKVVVHGRLDVYAPQGSYSLIVDRVESAGLGTLLARLEALKADLRARGWFDRRRPLPAYPRAIGVVTSRDGAALQDFLRTRSQRWPLYPVRLAHSQVQGPGAAEAIAAALRRLDASGVDVIVLCRGGGSLEDLWAFNELALAEAIWSSSVPVVTGVGHETDTTLADLVADRRAHTPTDAAAVVIPERRALLDGLERAGGYLAQAIDALLERRGERLQRAAASRTLRDPTRLLVLRAEVLRRLAGDLRGSAGARCDVAGTRTAELHRRLERSSPRRGFEARAARLQAGGLRVRALLERRLASAGERERTLARALEALSPLEVLRRGYSITFRRGSERPLTSAEGLGPADELETRLHAGRVVSRVERAAPLEPEAPTGPRGAPPAPG